MKGCLPALRPSTPHIPLAVLISTHMHPPTQSLPYPPCPPARPPAPPPCSKEWGRLRRRLRVEFARNDANVRDREKARRAAAEPSRTLFVAGFDPRSIRTRDIEKAFEPYGRLAVSCCCGGGGGALAGWLGVGGVGGLAGWLGGQAGKSAGG